MKVDVAIQSYKKPELLLYTLMSLYKYSKEHIDTVYINDDSDIDEDILKNIYCNKKVLNYFSGWTIRFRQNSKPSMVLPKFVKGFYNVNYPFYHLRLLKALILRENKFSKKDDIRYQYAFDNTNKKYIYVIHDDIIFKNDLLGLYLNYLEDQDYSAIGDIGQCWRCYHKNKCNPSLITNGIKPSKIWPKTPGDKKNDCYEYACRINEWSCLVSIESIKKIIEKYNVFFGNYYGNSDIAAFWFVKFVEMGYKFFDPLPTMEQRSNYYQHGWQGYSGHSAWVNQGDGIHKYDKNSVITAMIEDFGINLLE